MEETLKSLSMDYLNLLINGQAFSDVTFSVEGRLVHAHRCILAARSLFFRKFFCGAAADQAAAPPGALLLDHLSPRSPSGGASASSPRGAGGSAAAAAAATPGAVIPVSSVSYEVFLLLLQFLYSGQVSLVPQKGEPRPGCGERGCWHTHCAAAVDLALDTLAAARSFGVEELALLTQVINHPLHFPIPPILPSSIPIASSSFYPFLKKTEEKNSKENKIERFNFFLSCGLWGSRWVLVGYFGIGEHSAALI